MERRNGSAYHHERRRTNIPLSGFWTAFCRWSCSSSDGMERNGAAIEQLRGRGRKGRKGRFVPSSGAAVLGRSRPAKGWILSDRTKPGPNFSARPPLLLLVLSLFHQRWIPHRCSNHNPFLPRRLNRAVASIRTPLAATSRDQVALLHTAMATVSPDPFRSTPRFYSLLLSHSSIRSTPLRDTETPRDGAYTNRTIDTRENTMILSTNPPTSPFLNPSNWVRWDGRGITTVSPPLYMYLNGTEKGWRRYTSRKRRGRRFRNASDCHGIPRENDQTLPGLFIQLPAVPSVARWFSYRFVIRSLTYSAYSCPFLFELRCFFHLSRYREQ